MAQHCWQIRLLGGLQAQWGDLIVTQFPKRKVAILLAWLSYYSQQAHSREVLAEMLWPDEDPAPVQDRFRHTLQEVRRLIEPEGVLRGSALIADRNGVQLNSAGVQVDVARFEAGIQAASVMEEPELRLASLVESLEQYRGELLPGYYSDWILRERERLADRYRIALCEAATCLAQRGQIRQALELAQRAIEVDSTIENTHLLLMRLYMQAGLPAEATRQYHVLERILQQDLGQTPSPASLRMFEQLRQQEFDLAPLLPEEAIAVTVPQRLEPVGGAVPLESMFYLVRPADEELNTAIGHHDSIVLVKGARQTGKTSLLGRGLQQLRQAGATTFITDLQKFTPSQMASPDELFRVIAQSMIDELELEVELDTFWKSTYAWNVNFERFMRRQALRNPETYLVWALDEVDRLFTFAYSTEIFGLFRSWHNARSLDPAGPWSRLTLCIAYATEVHLFIKDLNQSPFNVGTRIGVDDFTSYEVAEMNRRYGAPLHSPEEMERFVRLVGGNPYLVRRGLEALATDKLSLTMLERSATREDSIFGGPLRHMLTLLRRDTTLMEAVKALLANQHCPSLESFYRLKSAGVIVGETLADARFRCQIYRAYLETHAKEV